MTLSERFDKFSNKVTQMTGSHWAFIGAFLLILIWGLCGPFFNFSPAWQMVVNTGTTIVTFLMVFIIQQSSNKDKLANNLKMNEILRAVQQADNSFIGIEDKAEKELQKIKYKIE